jgi:hypothetical protein
VHVFKQKFVANIKIIFWPMQAAIDALTRTPKEASQAALPETCYTDFREG